jgi:hypothetical protein
VIVKRVVAGVAVVLTVVVGATGCRADQAGAGTGSGTSNSGGVSAGDPQRELDDIESTLNSIESELSDNG